MHKKDHFLGMSYGSACHKLKKLILFDLLKRLNSNKCYRCGKEIEKVDELSIEHKKAWLDVDKKLFWDLDNISFSHLNCNTQHRRIGHAPKKVGPEGTIWCTKCKKFVPVEKFGLNPNPRWKRRYRYHCNDCRKKENWGHN